MLLEKIKICCRRYLNKNCRLAKEIEGTREQLEFVKRIKQGKITGFEAKYREKRKNEFENKSIKWRWKKTATGELLIQ